MPDPALIQNNRMRIARLEQMGCAVPVDQIYQTHLLEYLCGAELENARVYHEEQLAVKLTTAEMTIPQFQQQAEQNARVATLLAPMGAKG